MRANGAQLLGVLCCWVHQPPRKKKRPLSAGPSQRGERRKTGGRDFKPGHDSHTGEIFRRGLDQIPRGSATLMLKTIAADRRQTIYDSLSRLVETPMGALAFLREFADRTEGRPVQKHEVAPARETRFGPAADDVAATDTRRDVTATDANASIALAGMTEIVFKGPSGERFRPI